jgi:hypothetical protein
MPLSLLLLARRAPRRATRGGDAQRDGHAAPKMKTLENDDLIRRPAPVTFIVETPLKNYLMAASAAGTMAWTAGSSASRSRFLSGIQPMIDRPSRDVDRIVPPRSSLSFPEPASDRHARRRRPSCSVDPHARRIGRHLLPAPAPKAIQFVQELRVDLLLRGVRDAFSDGIGRGTACRSARERFMTATETHRESSKGRRRLIWIAWGPQRREIITCDAARQSQNHHSTQFTSVFFQRFV